MTVGNVFHVGEKIKRLRSFRGLTCAELAEIIGCTRPYLSAIENGRYPASTKILRKLHKALNVGMDYFEETSESGLLDTTHYNHENILANAKHSAGAASVSAGISSGGTRRIPFVAVSSGGKTSVHFDEYPSGDTDTIDCPSDITDINAFALRIDGSEMAPVIPAGSMVIVAPGSTVKPNRPVIAKLNNGEVLYRNYQAQREQVILLPNSHTVPIRVVGATDVEWIYPVQKVIIDLYNDPVK